MMRGVSVGINSKTIYRHENKYLLDARQEAVLRIRAEGALFKDPYAGVNGSYSISSLYFDDVDDGCFYDNINGVDRRVKYRIRIYNGDTSFIRLEKKTKKGGLTGKTSCHITEDVCRDLIEGRIGQTGEPLVEELRNAGLVPKVIVTYERIPYIYPAGNVRLTFDSNIESSTDTRAFLSGIRKSRPILPLGTTVMELKWDDFLPGHITDIFQIDGLKWTNYSKYCFCRAYHL